MKRITVSALVALSITALPGCSYVAQNELKSSLGECLARHGSKVDPAVMDLGEFQRKFEGEPLQVKLDFTGGDSAVLQIVEITHFAPPQSGPGAKEAAERLKPLANPADRQYSMVTTLSLQYQREGGDWQVKSGSEQDVTIRGRERSESAPDRFTEAELVAGLTRSFDGLYRSCLVDKRLTRRD
jgi:hypothetical protein